MKSYSQTMIAVLLARIKCSDVSQEDYPKKLVECAAFSSEQFNFLDYKSKGMFSRNILVRSLYFSDIIKKFKGKQIIVLGSGLDTKAIEFASKDSQVYYVDHPDSLHFSCKYLKRICDVNLSFIPFDLESDPSFLIETLIRKGFKKEGHTLIIWEGSSYYINSKSTLNLINGISSFLKVFDFYFDILCVNAYKYSSQGASDNIKYLQNINEKWVGYIDYLDIKNTIKNKRGISLKRFDRTDIEKRYLKEVKLKPNQMEFINIKKEI